jgi:hypothetical protein
MSAVHRTRRLMLALDAVALSLDELRQLDAWLHDRIAAAESEDIPQAANRVVVEERKAPTGTYRLELVKCGKERCKRCAKAPAHGPYWYRYWKQDGRTRSQYIGKTLAVVP